MQIEKIQEREIDSFALDLQPPGYESGDGEGVAVLDYGNGCGLECDWRDACEECGVVVGAVL